MHLINTPPPRSVAAKRNVLLRLFSSVWFGITLLTLILIYAAIASAVAPLRGAVEMTEMQIFRHWIFVALIVLFCITLAVATWVRIRWTLLNAGVLTVHAGLLLLCGGAIWYFGSKIEGHVLLRSPRVELVLSDGRPVSGAQVLAETGQGWSNTMPALGGNVGFIVRETRGEGMRPVSQAVVDCRVGAGEVKRVTLDAESAPTVPISDKLSLRLRIFDPEDRFFDKDVAALYFRPADATSPWRSVALPELPLYRERYLDEGYVLADADHKPVPSKRTSPTVDIFGLKLSTAWLENWRLPIHVDTGAAKGAGPQPPFDVEVTGYLPYVEAWGTTPVAGGRDDPAAVSLRLSDGRTTLPVLLFDEPAASVENIGVPVEFCWVASAAERDALLASRAGPHELEIEVVDPPTKQRMAIQKGQQIRLEGTPYELTIESFSDSWPLMSPGFAGATSPMASVQVNSGEKRYTRTVIQRFPQLSQDIDEQGVRHRDGPYDPNLVLRYRMSAAGGIMIIAGPGLPPTLGVVNPDGRMDSYPLVEGRPQRFELASTPVDLTLVRLMEHARPSRQPVITPVENRRPDMVREPSVIRLKLAGQGPYAGWTDSVWCGFSDFPHIDPHPSTVTGPDSRKWEFLYSRPAYPLDAQLAGRKLIVDFFPGKQRAESWVSEFLALPDRPHATPIAGLVKTNRTFSIGRWTLFQSGAAADHWSWTVLGVGNRNGIAPMVLGCVMITLGSLYAFYVKPVLRKRMQRRALEAARAASKLKPRTARGESQLVEVR